MTSKPRNFDHSIPYLSYGKMKDTDNVEMKEINNDETQRTEAVKAESFKTNGEEDTGGGDDSHHDHDGHKMRRGQGWGKGIVADIKRTILTHWKGEMTNLNGKVSLYTCKLQRFGSLLQHKHSGVSNHIMTCKIKICDAPLSQHTSTLFAGSCC